ncbi:caffeic acid 3-O-methyltransferase [Artemisia annua]|uniref:Caffeic acid 3-O-methyltransferase n=1 Tax=Artemisia annua TaxID=35608 RepID=A0A2U1KRR3_ARTAN|nr:caffeic acid 3-O-methyltransferase [Artemisia annua]
MSSTEDEIRKNEFTYAMQLATSTSLAMVLVNTIKLNVFEAIAKAGFDAQLSAYEIASRLSIQNQDAPDMLDRMLRLLASHSIVTCSQGEHESRPVRLYGLAPVAKYFILNEDGATLGSLMKLTQDKEYRIEHVEGDMFREVPKCDVIFMKWILHDWNDENCTKLLKNCYNALPQDGKIIVVDAILPFLPDTSSSYKVSTQMDAIMMTQITGGKERTYDELLALAKGAGFAGIKKECFVCNYWVMEFYK